MKVVVLIIVDLLLMFWDHQTEFIIKFDLDCDFVKAYVFTISDDVHVLSVTCNCDQTVQVIFKTKSVFWKFLVLVVEFIEYLLDFDV